MRGEDPPFPVTVEPVMDAANGGTFSAGPGRLC
jgi:hypothetical protein